MQLLVAMCETIFQRFENFLLGDQQSDQSSRTFKLDLVGDDDNAIAGGIEGVCVDPVLERAANLFFDELQRAFKVSHFVRDLLYLPSSENLELQQTVSTRKKISRNV